MNKMLKEEIKYVLLKRNTGSFNQNHYYYLHLESNLNTKEFSIDCIEVFRASSIVFFYDKIVKTKTQINIMHNLALYSKLTINEIIDFITSINKLNIIESNLFNEINIVVTNMLLQDYD